MAACVFSTSVELVSVFNMGRKKNYESYFKVKIVSGEDRLQR